jgi:hypothetical protein
VVERTCESRLTQKPLGEGAVGGMEGGKLLQCDAPLEIRLAGQIDDSGAAAADLPQDLVPSNLPENGLVLEPEIGVGHAAPPRSRSERRIAPGTVLDVGAVLAK